MHRETLQKVKHKIASLLDHPFPIESLHVKSASDIKDGALLVPKVILVAVHCPGRKLIDEDKDEGQLDMLYDEAVEMGGELLICVLYLLLTDRWVGRRCAAYIRSPHIIRLHEMVFKPITHRVKFNSQVRSFLLASTNFLQL